MDCIPSYLFFIFTTYSSLAEAFEAETTEYESSASKFEKEVDTVQVFVLIHISHKLFVILKRYGS